MRLIFCFLLVFYSVTACLAAVVGLDYGTQYVKEMVVSPKAPLEIVLTPESKRKEINGLALKAWKKNGPLERFYGSAATSLATRFPANTFMHLKPLLGKHYEDNMNHYHREHPGFEFLSAGDRNAIAFKVDEKTTLSVEELVAMDLGEFIQRANNLLVESGDSDRVTSLAIAVPEYFNQEQRASLLDSADLTEVKNTYLCNDAMAVTIDYALKQRSFEPGEKQFFIIYDLGAGSTTASLMSIEQPENVSLPLKLEFLGYDYTEALSGSRFTLAIMDILENDFLEHHQDVRTEQLEGDHRAMAKLVQAAEKAKLILSANAEASVSIESLYEEIDFRTTVTRSQFEDFITELQTAVVEPIYNALRSAFINQNLTIPDLSSVILTGGSTRVPFVKKQLEMHLGSELISKNVNADESAVNGVVIRGVQLSNEFKSKPMDIVDRTVHSFGVSVGSSGDTVTIFEAGSRYPNETTIQLSQAETSAEVLTINFMENGRVFKTAVADFVPVRGKFTPEKCSRGVNYNATFTLDENKIYSLKKIEAICQKDSVEDQVDLDENTEKLLNKKVTTAKMNVPFSSENVHVKPLSSKEKNDIRLKLNRWNRLEKERIQLQNQLNILEASLYDARAFLEDESVVEKGPKADSAALESLIDEYLDWVNYDSDNAKLAEVDEKILKLSILRGKIEIFMNSIDEPLDRSQFSDLVEKARDLITNFNQTSKEFKKDISILINDFDAINLNVSEEYLKIKPPKSIQLAEHKTDQVLEDITSIVKEISILLDEGKLDTLSREELFEVKVIFDGAYSQLEELVRVVKLEHLHRLKELKSLYSRKLRVLKKKEERKEKEKEIKATASSNSTSENEPDKVNEELEFEQDEL